MRLYSLRKLSTFSRKGGHGTSSDALPSAAKSPPKPPHTPPARCSCMDAAPPSPATEAASPARATGSAARQRRRPAATCSRHAARIDTYSAADVFDRSRFRGTHSRCDAISFGAHLLIQNCARAQASAKALMKHGIAPRALLRAPPQWHSLDDTCSSRCARPDRQLATRTSNSDQTHACKATDHTPTA